MNWCSKSPAPLETMQPTLSYLGYVTGRSFVQGTCVRVMVESHISMYSIAQGAHTISDAILALKAIKSGFISSIDRLSKVLPTTHYIFFKLNRKLAMVNGVLDILIEEHKK